MKNEFVMERSLNAIVDTVEVHAMSGCYDFFVGIRRRA